MTSYFLRTLFVHTLARGSSSTATLCRALRDDAKPRRLPLNAIGSIAVLSGVDISTPSHTLAEDGRTIAILSLYGSPAQSSKAPTAAADLRGTSTVLTSMTATQRTCPDNGGREDQPDAMGICDGGHATPTTAARTLHATAAQPTMIAQRSTRPTVPPHLVSKVPHVDIFAEFRNVPEGAVFPRTTSSSPLTP